MRSLLQPSYFQNLNRFYASLLCFYFLFSFFIRALAGEISYSDHCASIVPESKPTRRVPRNGSDPLFDLTRSYFWGGGEAIHAKFKNTFDLDMEYSQAYYVSFRTTRNVFETGTKGTYKVETFLEFQFRSEYDLHSIWLRLLLNGFWSEASRKLCMIGAGSLDSEKSNPLKLEAVFELNYANKNSTLFTSLAKGSLRSLSPFNSSNYFVPIEIVSFPNLADYSYTLSSKGLEGGFLGGNEPLSLQPLTCICYMFQWESYGFDLEFAAGCKSSQDCSPFNWDPAYLFLSSFQCSENEGKLRYMISFQKVKYGWSYGTFDPNGTLIGEGIWDSKRNQLCITACRVLNPSNSLGDVSVGDCSIRLGLIFPVVLTLKQTHTILGQIWTSKTVGDSGFFKNIKFSRSGPINNGKGLPSLRYEYTETEKARELCPRNQVGNESGEHYPTGDSYDMRFHMYARYSKEMVAYGDAVPFSVGNELFGQTSFTADSGYGEEADSQINISYTLNFFAMKSQQDHFFSANSSLNYEVKISAEGIYDAATGQLCMVGCLEIHRPNRTDESLDCEIFMEFQFPSLSSKIGTSIRGTIQSKRSKEDSLYFKPLIISSEFHHDLQAKKSIWRMDLEIVLVLISNALLLIFVSNQIFHVRKDEEVLPSISLVMLTILTLGHTIPLVLKLEALLFKNHKQQEMVLEEKKGWFELDEVSVRLVNLAVFLLFFRLLQMAWTAKNENGDQNHHLWNAEKKTVFLLLLLYYVGGVITSMNSHQASIFAYLKSCGGLVLDGFLLPQILLNILQNSRENPLSCWFYIGTTLVRMFPHAYDLYQAQNYADFYSIGWDLIILSGCILLAVIIWLQQRFGGRCVLPRKLRELGSCLKVPSKFHQP